MAKPNHKPQSSSAKYPHATVAFYGPDDSVATLAIAGVIPRPGTPPTVIAKWHSRGLDVREDPVITHQIVSWIQSHGVRHSTVAEEIMGCPHEAGVDYPEGESCPLCLYWKTRRRFPRT